MTLAERILELLEGEGKPLTNKHIANKLHLVARDMTGLASALTDLNRAKRVRYVNGDGWEVAEVEAPSAPPTRKPAKIEKTEEAPKAAPAVVSKAPPLSHRITPETRAAGKRDRENILKLLANGVTMKTGAVAEALGLTPKTASNRLSRMEARGFIVKQRHGYALPSATVADALDVRVIETPYGTVAARTPTAEEISEASFDLHDQAPKFTEARPLADVTVPSKFDAPIIRDVHIHAHANGFEVSEMNVTPTHVFNRFVDLVEHLRSVYFA